VYEALGSRIGYRDEKREITAAFSGGALALLAAGAVLSLLWFRRLI
jgi:Ca-activated chloride channel family protein